MIKDVTVGPASAAIQNARKEKGFVSRTYPAMGSEKAKWTSHEKVSESEMCLWDGLPKSDEQYTSGEMQIVLTLMLFNSYVCGRFLWNREAV